VSQADVDVVQSFLNAFTSGDLETVFGKLSHPEIVIREADSLPYGGDNKGVEGFQGLLAKMFEVFELSVDSYEVSDAGAHVMVNLVMSFTSRASGRVVKMPGVEVYTIRGGQVAVVDVFYKDTKAIVDLVAG
jgi:ketosteroid isomerase-like protein